MEYRDALWWQVSWSDDASRFLRASLAGAVVLGALALNSLLGARFKRHKAEPIPDVVRQLVAKSPESDANIALLGDKSFLLDPDDRAALAYAEATGQPLQIQWTLIAGLTDSDDDLERLAAWCRGRRVVVNVIAYNEVEDFEHRRVDRDRMHAITRRLHAAGIVAKLRDSAGQDVAAGCGQLAGRR